MPTARWTALEKEALKVAAEIDDIAAQLSKLGIDPSVARSHARLLRDLVVYVNQSRAEVSQIETWRAASSPETSIAAPDAGL